MSYLQRLAERALGQTRPLRALAPQRLPGAEVSTQVDEVPTPLSRPATQPQAMAHARAAPLPSEAPRQQPAAWLDGDTDPAAQAASRRIVAASTRLLDAQPPAAPVQIEHLAERADADGATPAPMSQEPLPLLAMQPLHRATQIPARPWPTGEAADDAFAGTDAAQPDGPALRMPSPLLPRIERRVHEPAPHPALRPSPVQPEARQRAGAVEETTEVHVTIGRIEVTAVQEAAAQKPASRRRPAPMSLDEYIARRQGGRA